MSKIDELQKEFEGRLAKLISERPAGGDADVATFRALVHQAIHFAAERKSIEFCAVATFLGEMIGHAHQLLHGSDRNHPAHKDVVH